MVRFGAVLACLTAALPTGLLAQATTTPVIPGVVAAGTPIEVIGEDFGSTEGPVGTPDGGILFTSGDVIRKIAPDGTASVYKEQTNGANGLAYDAQGRLVAVQTGNQPGPRIAIMAPDAEDSVLVDNWQGRPFIRPNDLVVDSKGGVYFTDPAARPAAAGEPLSTPSSVYYLRPDGRLLLLDNRMRRPNGIQLSPDGGTLYVADSILEDLIAFDVMPDGSVTNGRVFAKVEGSGPAGSGADGMAMDAQGRLFTTSTRGIQVFTPRGEFLGMIETPRQPQNVAFSGPDKRYLYIVGRGGVYRVRTETQGVQGRAK